MSEQPLNTTKIVGRPGLTAGGDATISDISGMVAIGEYISQFMIKEPSGEALVKLISYLEQRRQEESNLEILNSYSPSALPYFDPKVKEFVVTNRVEELNKALVYLQDHRLLLFAGIGGAGKTTLARALIDIRPAKVPIPFWFDFRQNEDAKVGDILVELAAYMNSPDLIKFRKEEREAEKKDINKLTDKLQEGKPIWLIFDNLETVLDDIYFHDEYMDLLFSSLRNNVHQAKIIITSRIFPKSKNGEYLIDVVEGEKQDVKGLKINFAVDYLVKNGLGDLEPDKLKKLATGVDGHPLAMKLLVELVKEFGEEDVLEDLSMYQEKKEDTILKARKLFDKLAGNEKGLLERISVYREPVGMKGLKKMFMEKTSLNDIKKLIDKSLLETDHKRNYWLHPLVQEFAYDDLENKTEVHKLAIEYYLPLPIPEKPTKKEDIQSLIEAHHHACMAGEYDQAFHIIFDKKLHEYLNRWGNYTVLIDLFLKMLPEKYLENEILLKDIGAHGLIIKGLGNVYYEMGDSRTALKHYKQALKIATEIEDRLLERDSLGNLGSAYRNLGDLGKAIEYHEQALKIATEIRDRQGEGRAIGNLGNVYSGLGDNQKAIKYYEQALEITKEIGDRSGEGNYLGNMGGSYLNLGDSRKAIDCCEEALKIAKEIGGRIGEARAIGTLGSAYRELSDNRKAIEYYEQALKIAKEIGDRRGQGYYLGFLGDAYLGLSDPRKTIDCCEEALKIAKEIGDMIGEENSLESLGCAYRNLGNLGKAIEYHEQTLKIATEIGDKLSEGNSLESLGCVYRNLGNLGKAIEYHEQALKIATEIGNRIGEGNSLESLGCAYRNLGNLGKAIEYHEQALKIATEIGNRIGEGNSLESIGCAYRNLGNLGKAIEYHEQALKIATEIGNRQEEAVNFGNLGITYSDLGETRKAIEYYEQALRISREIGDRQGEAADLGNLGVAYSDLGETRKAIEYYEQAFEINPEDVNACYNKACAYSLMNKKSEALTYLKRAVELNPDYKEYAKSDKDFEKLWKEKDFKDIVTTNKKD